MATGESPASSAYHDLARRMGDEQKTVEKIVCDLFNSLKNRSSLSTQTSKCITIPKKLDVKAETPGHVITGTVWHWSDLRHSRLDLICEYLQNQSGTNECFAATQMEICLNPNHYVCGNDAQLSPKEVWATVAYYERDTRVGQTFLCSSNSVIIGCYGEEHQNGVFDLGAVVKADRDYAVEQCRRQIGKGVRLHYYGGEMFLELVSEGPIFVQSHYHNLLRGLEGKMACRLVHSGCSIMRLMDDNEFGEVLCCCIEDGMDAVFEAAKMGTIRVSFGQPWGRDWGVEEDVRSVPCWIEVRLIRHLKRLEKTLEQLGCPYKLHY